MKQLRYDHLNSPPLVVALYKLLRVVVGRLLSGVMGRWTLTRRQQRILSVAAVVITLVIQSVILALLYQAIELSISLMEVWAELASYHFALTSVRPS